MLQPDLTTDENFWAQWIAAAGSNPTAWLDSATRLKRAADLLPPIYQTEMHAMLQEYAVTGEFAAPEPRFELAPVYLMLSGYAVENLAKGLIAAKEGVIPPAQHLSEELMQRAGVELESGEPALVRRLSLFLTSFGRYPVPQMKDAGKLVHGSIVTAPMRYSTNDPNEINPLYERMREELERVIAAATVV